ncbi:MAG: amino acid permease [Candidatus Kariarchaeaceae archaeon]
MVSPYFYLCIVALVFGLFVLFMKAQIRRIVSVKEAKKIEASLPSSELTRDLKEFDITMIGIGAMIGAGIFVLTGIAAGIAGPALLLVFLFNAIFTTFTAMVYAELGSAMPESGGGYLWVKSGLQNNFQSYISGMMNLFADVAAASLYSLGFASYVMLLSIEAGWGISDSIIIYKLIAIIAIILFATLNFWGSSEMGKIGNIITSTKIVIIAVFILSGLWIIFKEPVRLDEFSPIFPEGSISVVVAMGLTFIAFEGYEIIVQTGEEVELPSRSIPRAIFRSIMWVVPIYLLVAIAALGGISQLPDVSITNPAPSWQILGDLGEEGLAHAAKEFMPFGVTLLLFGGLVSTLSALNATVYASTRVAFAMGRDKFLPDPISRVNKWRRTPHWAVFGVAIFVMIVSISLPIEDVAAAAGVMFILLFLQVDFSLFFIRSKYGNRLIYGYKMPLYPLIPIIGIISKLGIIGFMVIHYPTAIFGVIVWLSISALYWLFVARKKFVNKPVSSNIKEFLRKEE